MIIYTRLCQTEDLLELESILALFILFVDSWHCYGKILAKEIVPPKS